MKFSKQQTAYVSEFTKFIEELKQKNPSLEEKQRSGRAIWWDKSPVDLETRRREQESRVKQQPYVYQNKF
ncbi:MAG TPA: DUF3460 family protein [Noviherbaspirillum sp.]|uniref:DUF3460 family protein n=1 Tax=Noviherbaspirillum sp. TaxID=1926288 RepID=UPI002D486CFD|nr:DUF3460 family protein [Noviherbaspirillum sp.]HYD97159.1 DUF3460 family protein [Noviherbaspirillum sp.]